MVKINWEKQPMNIKVRFRKLSNIFTKNYLYLVFDQDSIHGSHNRLRCGENQGGFTGKGIEKFV